MSWKNQLGEYLSFGRRDRIGIISLLILILLIYLLPILFEKTPEPVAVSRPAPAAAAAAIDSMSARKRTPPHGNTGTATEARSPVDHEAFRKGRLFRFNPNTLDVEGWKKLGLNERTARTIGRYRSRGGTFYKPEDLLRIHGMPHAFYDWVRDSIELPRPGFPRYERQSYSRTPKTISPVSINQADSAAWEALPGIGSRLAARIVAFRDKLGGFYSIDQVRETYGLPDSSFQKISSYLRLNGEVRKININTADKEILKQHPYIRWKLANAIVEFRNQHGNFTSLDDLKKIGAMDAASYKKISPYLEL